MIHYILLLILSQHFESTLSESLNDIALKVPTGSWIINSSLVDSETNQKYIVNEIIYSNYKVEGKISISSSSLKWDVFYSTTKRNVRLVIHDGQCDLITYNTKWDSKLPGITNPLLNHILMVGPSVTHRLAQHSLLWEEVADAEMRGVMMHSKSTTIGGKSLNITNYYIKGISSEKNIDPSVTVFTGSDPSEPNGPEETITMHTYTRMEKSASTEGLVTPEPGIGCPFYFAQEESDLFSQSFSRLHYIVDIVEQVAGSKKTVKTEEVYIDEVTQQMNIASTIDGKKSREIYDFTLGIKYQNKQYNSCPIKQLDLSIPGIVVGQNQDKMNINTHLGFNRNYKFVGIVQDPHTVGRDLYVWESVEHNATFNGKQYFKLVTTQYLFRVIHEDYSGQFVLHSTTINGYMQAKLNPRNVLKISRIYRKFEPELELESEDYDLIFNVEECYPFASQHRTISLHFRCETSAKGDCDHSKSQLYQLHYAIKLMIIQTNRISASRISNIEVIPESNGATAYITFLEAPKMKEVFHSTHDFQPFSSLASGSFRFKADSNMECLELASNSGQSYPTIVYCHESDDCFAFRTPKEFPEEKDGSFCEFYQIPLRNLVRFRRELSFDKIVSDIDWKNLNFKLSDSRTKALYSCDHVENVASKAERKFDSSFLNYEKRRMIPNDENVIKIEGVKNAGECFHECLNSDKFDCRSISVCSNVDEPECMISNLSSNALKEEDMTTNSSCKVLFRNSILDYVKVSNRRYKSSPTVAILDFYPEKCADLCYETDSCSSFQDCKRDCTFGGYYTDSSTEFSPDCDIYIPKALHKFIDNGKRIVTDVIHTEIGLTLDQCAALCHDWENLDEVCQSFNFCPSAKSTSSCELSKYTLEDSSTKTVDSKVCYNYGYRTTEVAKSRTPKIVKDESSTKTVIGSITIFVGIGFIVGFVLPIVYAKLRTLNNSRLNKK